MNLKRFLIGKEFSYYADGFATRNKNLGFMGNPLFTEAYEWSAYFTHNGRRSHWASHDVRWRAHICLWAATQALKIEGDFAEAGVFTGTTAGVIVKCLDFSKLPRRFYLFDTFEGIPNHPGMTEHEHGMKERHNKGYFDSYELVRAKFEAFPNVEIVRGLLPGTLDALEGRKIAYLSVDLNNAPAEIETIERLWPQLSSGCIIVLDDYAFTGHTAQYEAWNSFAGKHGLMVATLPTGQGLLIKGG
ncbi:MAG: TylF/MycF/NovP-related O-methyltransferase [Rhodomicrobium sp.]